MHRGYSYNKSVQKTESSFYPDSYNALEEYLDIISKRIFLQIQRLKILHGIKIAHLDHSKSVLA